jgi:hypothetical protein
MLMLTWWHYDSTIHWALHPAVTLPCHAMMQRPSFVKSFRWLLLHVMHLLHCNRRVVDLECVVPRTLSPLYLRQALVKEYDAFLCQLDGLLPYTCR